MVYQKKVEWCELSAARHCNDHSFVEIVISRIACIKFNFRLLVAGFNILRIYTGVLRCFRSTIFIYLPSISSLQVWMFLSFGNAATHLTYIWRWYCNRLHVTFPFLVTNITFFQIRVISYTHSLWYLNNVEMLFSHLFSPLKYCYTSSFILALYLGLSSFIVLGLSSLPIVVFYVPQINKILLPVPSAIWMSWVAKRSLRLIRKLDFGI